METSAKCVSMDPEDGVYQSGSGSGTGVITLVSTDATEFVPPLKRVSGFFIRYFIVPWKDGGLHQFLGLCRLNHSV